MRQGRAPRPASPADGRAEAARPRLEAGYFDALYATSADPWDFATSAYEQAKYDRTLAALDGRRFARALEVGCSIGILSTRLAACCEELVAVDVAQRAVELARARLAGCDHVRIERRRLPEELPDGTWDLIVCSEVLYYWDRATLERALGRFTRALRPGGALLAVHWRQPTRTYPLRGDEVHALLRAQRGLHHVAGHVEAHYRLDRYDRYDRAGP